MTAAIDDSAEALSIPVGPRWRAAHLRSIDGDEAAAAELAARLLLTHHGGTPDGLAVVLVRLAGPQPLAAWAGERLNVSKTAMARAIESTASDLASSALVTVAEAVALRCHRAGVRKVYAYPGTSELALCHAFAALTDGLLINSRGDAEAVFMAGGGSSATRRPEAAAVVHGARGLTNAAGAVGDLRRNEVPVLILVGLPSTRSAQFLPPHGEDRLLDTVGGLAKAARQLDWTGRARAVRADPVAVVDEAMAMASALPTGPVLLGLPQDILEARIVPVEALAKPQPPAQAVTTSSLRALRRARSLLSRAKSPVILIDDYLLHHAGAAAALAALTERFQAPIFQLRYRRGPMLFQQLTAASTRDFLGPYDPANGENRARMNRADLLITIEARNAYRRVAGDLPACRKIAITSDPGKTRRNGYLGTRDVLLAGDPVRIIRAVLNEKPVRAHGPETTSTGDSVAVAADDESTEPVERLRSSLAAVVRGCLSITGARYVVDDSQMVGGLLAADYEHAFGDATVIGDHGGFVGAGIPTATGLSITHGTSVLCLLGDQGFTNGFQGLVAAAQEKAPVLYVVCNNGESVSLREQSAELSPVLTPPDFDRLLRNPPGFSYVAAALAAGVPAVAVDLVSAPATTGLRPGEQILETVEELCGEGGPSLLELRLPGHGIAWKGVWATHGFDEAPDRPGRRRRRLKAGPR